MWVFYHTDTYFYLENLIAKNKSARCSDCPTENNQEINQVIDQVINQAINQMIFQLIFQLINHVTIWTDLPHD